LSADTISIRKIGILESAKNEKNNHASLMKNCMYEFGKNAKDINVIKNGKVRES